MKKIILFVISSITILTSCTKKDTSTTTLSPKIMWTFRNIQYQDNNPRMDTSANSTLQINSLVTSDLNNIISDISLNTTSVSIGNYMVDDSVMTNTFVHAFQDSINSISFHMAENGNISINQINNQKISGNFSVNVDGEAIIGSFENVPLTNY